MESSKTLCSPVDLRILLFPINVFSITATLLHDVTSVLQLLMGFSKTLFLFTKSDIKTILVPVTVFAVATVPRNESTSLPLLVLWIWLHTLQCALANQSLGPDEDAVNKPDRPIPAGRITVAQARFMRWTCLIPCFMFSAWYSISVLKASVALAFFLIVYNELQFNTHWLGRNILNGAGLACFEAGATLIAGSDRNTIDAISKLAIVISVSIFVTTVHAQDFKDELGDMKVGRRTLPMIFPVASRVFVLVALVFWSVGLAVIWGTGPLTTAGLLTLSTLVGGRFVLLKSVLADQKSFYLYNLWLSLANALPALTYRAM